jgi:hypothetical protein
VSQAKKSPGFWKKLPPLDRSIIAYVVAAVGTGILVNILSEGRGHIIYLGIVVAAIIVIILRWGDREAVKHRVRRLFWLWGVFSFVFVTTILICKIVIVQSFRTQLQTANTVNSNLSSKNLTLSNALDESNVHFLSIISNKDASIVWLTNELDKVKAEDALHMSIDWSPNWLATQAKELLFAGKYSESVKYYNLCGEADKRITYSTLYFDLAKPYYFTAILMTNDNAQTENNYLIELSDNIETFKAKGNMEWLGDIQGEIGEVESITPPNLYTNLKTFTDDMAAFKLEHAKP